MCNAVGLVEACRKALNPFGPSILVGIPQNEYRARLLAHDGQIAVGEHERMARVLEVVGKERNLETVRHDGCPVFPLYDQGRIAYDWAFERFGQVVGFDLEPLADGLVGAEPGGLRLSQSRN